MKKGAANPLALRFICGCQRGEQSSSRFALMGLAQLSPKEERGGWRTRLNAASIVIEQRQRRGLLRPTSVATLCF
jgi:hypothetical protein